MRTTSILPAALAAALLLCLPLPGQAAHEHGATPGDTAPAAPAAPAVNQDKVYLLKQEFTAKTAELRGRLKAREADLEILLATKPGDETAVKKLAADISGLRGQLFEQTTLFRQRYARETGTPLRQTLHLGTGPDGLSSDMGGGGMECMMQGKGKGQGMMSTMGGMDHSAAKPEAANSVSPATPAPPAKP